jgi:hypothetical protein
MPRGPAEKYPRRGFTPQTIRAVTASTGCKRAVITWRCRSGPQSLAHRLPALVEQTESPDVVYPSPFHPGMTDSVRASTICLEPGEMATADVALAAALHLRLTAPGLGLSQPINVSVSQSAFGLPALTQTSFRRGAIATPLGSWVYPTVRVSAQ